MKRAAPEAPHRVLTVNRQARHDYDILRTLEAGLVLSGTEIKSLRAGRGNIREAYAAPADGELWLHGAHIARYDPAGPNNHEPARSRKLLLHRDQIDELAMEVQSRGLTIVPLRLYLKGRVAKVELGLARGRKKFDKREAIARRETDRRIQHALRRRA